MMTCNCIHCALILRLIDSQKCFSSRGFFKTFAKFIQSRVAPLLPCQDVADTVCLTIGNSFVSLTSKDGIPFDDVKVRQIIGEWESIGMLKEFIRCSTFPQLGDQFHFPPAVLKIYESLSNTCTLLVR